MAEIGEFAPSAGDVFEPDIARLRRRRLRSLGTAVIGAAVALLWQLQVGVLNGKPLSTRTGIVGLVFIPLGVMAYFGANALLKLAGRLVIGDESLQIVTDDQTIVQIPFLNVANTYTRGGAKGVVGIKLINRRDPATRTPLYISEGYEIQSFIYGRTPQEIQAAIDRRLTAFRTLRPAAATQAATDQT